MSTQTSLSVGPTPTPSPSPISTLPLEVMLKIFGSLPPEALSATSQVCWLWLQFANDKKFTEARGYELCVPANAEIYAQRRAQLDACLDEVSKTGTTWKSRFAADTSILDFDLQSILEKYPECKPPASELCQFMEWAEIDQDKIATFKLALSKCGGLTGLEAKATELLSRMYSYFTQRRAKTLGTPQGTELKEQFRSFVDCMIDFDKVCIIEALPQLQETVLETLVEGDISSRAGTLLTRIKLRAGLELYKYRNNLLKEICARQNPELKDTAILKSYVAKKLASVFENHDGTLDLHLSYSSFIWDIDSKAKNALDAFLHEYNPVRYLATKLTPCQGNLQKLRNDLVQHVLNHYNMLDGTKWKNHNLNFTATLFLLKAAGLIQEIQPTTKQ